MSLAIIFRFLFYAVIFYFLFKWLGRLFTGKPRRRQTPPVDRSGAVKPPPYNPDAVEDIDYEEVPQKGKPADE